MPAFYVEEVDSLKDQLGKLPAFLRKLIEDLLLPPLEKAAPAAFGEDWLNGWWLGPRGDGRSLTRRRF